MRKSKILLRPEMHQPCELSPSLGNLLFKTFAAPMPLKLSFQSIRPLFNAPSDAALVSVVRLIVATYGIIAPCSGSTTA